MRSSSLTRTPKLHLAVEQPLTGECWIPPQKDSPHPRTKEKPKKDSRRAKILFRIEPHTSQRCSEGSDKTLYAPEPRDPTETEPDLPLSVGVSAAEAGVSTYATGEEWRNNSKRMKRQNQSKNNSQLWMRLVMEVKSDAVKNNIT